MNVATVAVELTTDELDEDPLAFFFEFLDHLAFVEWPVRLDPLKFCSRATPDVETIDGDLEHPFQGLTNLFLEFLHRLHVGDVLTLLPGREEREGAFVGLRYFGAYKSRKVSFNLETIRLLLRDFVVLPFDEDDFRQAGEVRAELKKSSTPIGPYDVLIAGQAKTRGLILVSNSVREFGRVSDLRLEDWTVSRRKFRSEFPPRAARFTRSRKCCNLSRRRH